MSNRRRIYAAILCWALVLLGLYAISRYNYLLFHGLAEVFSIAVACGIFMIAWNSRPHADSNYLLFIGVAYLFVGGMDMLHTLSYTGMGVFSNEYGTNLTAQLWIVARYMESLSLFLAPLFMDRKMRMRLFILGYVLVFSLALAAIFYWGIFPDCYIEGYGLTPFKVTSEYIIMLIFLGAVPLMLRKRQEFDKAVLQLLIASIVVSIVSEFAFTLYVSAYGLPSAIGHFLKVISFILIYTAIVRTGLEKPYRMLFRKLGKSEERYRLLAEESPLGISLIGQDGTYEYVNTRFKGMFGYDLDDIPTGRDWFRKAYPNEEYRKEVMSAWLSDLADAKLSEFRPRTYSVTCKNGEVKEILFRPVPLQTGDQLVLYEDTTEQRRIEAILQHHREFEKLIIDISTGFINLPPGDIDEGINQALRAIGWVSGVDRSYVFLLHNDKAKVGNTHEWCADGIESRIGNLKDIVLDEEFPWFAERMRRFEVVHVPRAADLPPEAKAEKEYLQMQHIQSLIMVPMSQGGEFAGFLGFDSVRTEREWSEGTTALLKIVSGIFVNAIERRKAEVALRHSERRYRRLIDRAGAAIIVIQDGAIKLLNPRIVELTGYSEDELTTRPFHDLIHPDDRGMAPGQDMENLRRDELPRSHSFRIIDRDGNVKWVESSTVTIPWEEERALQIFLSDVTERKQMEELIRSLARFPEENPCPVMRAAGDGTILYANDASKALLGIWRRQINQTLPDSLSYLVLDSLNSGSSMNTEVDCENRIFSLTFAPIVSEGYVNVYGFDITERKRAEEALQESEERYRGVVEDMPLLICSYLPGGEITFVNQAYCRYFARTPEDLVGTSFMTLISESDREMVMANISALTVESPVQSHEHRVIAPDGEILWQRWTNRALFDAHGQAVAYQSVGEDITERKQMADALRVSQEMFARAFQFSPNPMSVSRMADGWIASANDRFMDTLGYSPGDLIGHSSIELGLWGGPEERGKLMNTLQERGYVRNIELQVHAKSGELRLVNLSAAVTDIHNQPHLIAIAEDITQRRQVEEELQKVEKLEAVGTLAGGIAHDLNNLLVGVMGNISLARMCEDPVERDMVLEKAEKASIRINRLTKQLLTFSKGGAPVLETADIAGLLRDSAVFVLRGTNVGCEFSIPDDLWSARVDVGQVSQVISNLVINAQQAMPEGGTVMISAENADIGMESGLPLKPGAYIKVSVQDHGLGISEKYLHRIFEPFFTTKQSGSGLGLATSYSIVRKHNGHITVESQLGVGTTFHIYLPVSPGEALVTGEEEEGVPIMGEGRILVMDDEEIVRELAREMLTSLGYRVTIAADGPEAIEVYREAMDSGEAFDAVIIDLTIQGGMGGREIVQRFMGIDPDIKAIVSSGYFNDPVLANFRKHGFIGSIPKPYTIQELSEVLHRALASAD